MYVSWEIVKRSIAKHGNVRFMKLDLTFIIKRSWFEKKLFDKQDKTFTTSFVCREGDHAWKCLDLEHFGEVQQSYGVASSINFNNELVREWEKVFEKEKKEFYKNLEWTEIK